MSGRIDSRRKLAIDGSTPTKRVPGPPDAPGGMLFDREEEESVSKMLAPSCFSVATVLKLVLRRWMNELLGVANHLGSKVIEDTAQADDASYTGCSCVQWELQPAVQ